MAEAPAFTQPRGTESRAVPPGTGPLSAPSPGADGGSRGTELSARRPSCRHPRPSSPADAVTVSPSLLLQPRGDKSQGCGDGKEGAKLYL